MPFLQLSDITKHFGANVAVERFNLGVERGEFVTFLGPSGCGKTTVLRMVAGFEQPTAGQIVLNNRDITTLPPNQRKIGMVFQSYALFPHLTAADNVAFGLKLTKMPTAEIKARVAEMLDLVLLGKFGGRYPYQLSGGQQQRVALARALALQPDLLLLDEPLSALDAKVRAEVRDEIRRIQRRLNITTVFVTHDQEEALSISDRIVVMNQGAVEQEGPPFEIYNYPRTAFVAAFVGTLNRLAGHVVDATQGRVRLGDVTLQTEAPLPHSDGAKVTVMMRPEELRLITVDADVSGLNGNVLDATVEAISFLGAVVRLQVRTSLAPLTIDVFNERQLQLPAVGDQRRITVPPEACLVMTDA
ncbi:MAG: ABC transporter ATP-binding protein [Anaerolineales bacterium]|nr:ABC transporter ATP-binding protein [Anaerolineales bacterium]